MFLIHLCLLSWSFFSIGNGKTTSESFDNESVSNSQYIYTAEAIHNESVLTEHSYALGTDVLDIVKDDSTNNENKNEQTSNLTYMVYQLKHRIVELANFFGDFMNFLILLDPIICLVPRQ
jgi:hypothetical protein